MKQIIAYIYFALLVVACTTPGVENLEQLTDDIGSDELVYSFTVTLPKHKTLNSRGTADEVTDLQLLVFDEEHQLLSRNKAILEGVSGGSQKFKVVLLSSDKPRYIHYIADYDDWDSFPETHMIRGADEGEVVSYLVSKKETGYWARLKYDRLDSNTNLSFLSSSSKVSPISVLRNKAKISISLDKSTTKIEQAFVYNSPKNGYIAQFYYDRINSKVEFDFDPFEVPSEKMPELKDEEEMIQNGNSFELDVFEKENKSSNANKMFLIVKIGRRWYKVDIAQNKKHAGHKEYLDILRNIHYKITVKKISHDGYSTRQEAIDNPASNNLYTSIELYDYPMISNGTSQLSIDRISEVLVEPGKFNTFIQYIPNLRFPSSTSPESVSVRFKEDNTDDYIYNYDREDSDPLPGVADLGKVLLKSDGSEVLRYMYIKETGTIQIKASQIPKEEVHQHVLEVFSTSEDEDNIVRFITITLRQPFKFIDFGYEEFLSGNMNLFFTVPEKIPASICPIAVRFDVDQLTPIIDYGNSENPKNPNLIITKTEGGHYYYEFLIKEEHIGKKIILPFTRNLTSNKINVKMSSKYFNDEKLNFR